MDWLDNWNKVISCIEDKLDKEIDIEDLSKMVCCSTFHFQRMFAYLTDMSLTEYIRRRKMTRCAYELQNSDIKIIDIAIKYGYDSPTAFNRAFQSIHGIAPSKARNKGVALKAYPPIIFTIQIKGENEMNYRIEEKPAFKIIGVKRHYHGIDESQVKVPSFWTEAKANQLIQQLCKLMDKEPFGLLGVCSTASCEEFDYYIAVASGKKTPKGFAELSVPKTTWAIFECVGAMPKAIQNLQKRIMSEWLPTSGYDYANQPDMEVYPDGDMSSPSYKCEVWIPVTRKV